MRRCPALTVTLLATRAGAAALALAVVCFGGAGCEEPAIVDGNDLLRPPAQPPVSGGDDDDDDDDGDTPVDPPVTPPAPRCAADDVDEDAVVRTSNGNVRGERVDGTWRFRGIRYAARPTGERRFAPPVEPECVAGDVVMDALDYGNSCPQLGLLGDEDCLFLNVWSPALARETSAGGSESGARPVLFFIHGGGNILGEASQSLLPGSVLYDGQKLSEEAGAVVVTVNYRLGALGFLAHPALTARDGVSGNQAIRDLVLALEWTRDNVAAFGGDPGRVMIFGESAGALNTCALVASPHAAGLFHAALMESGGCDAPRALVREAQGVEAMESIGCGRDDLECLLSVSTEQTTLALAPLPDAVRTWSLTWGLTTDGDVLPDAPLALIERGEHNRVPFAVGSNAHEMNLFIPLLAINTCIDYALALEVLAPDSAGAVLDEYPCFDAGLPHDTFIKMSTDLVFTCQARRVARAMASSQPQPVWRYHFRDRTNMGPLMAMGAFHAAELFFVFDKLDDVPGYIATGGEHDLTTQMQRYWGRLAANGDPNAPGEVEWPTTDGDSYLVLDEDPFAGMEVFVEHAADADVDDGCDFWDSVAD